MNFSDGPRGNQHQNQNHNQPRHLVHLSRASSNNSNSSLTSGTSSAPAANQAQSVSTPSPSSTRSTRNPHHQQSKASGSSNPGPSGMVMFPTRSGIKQRVSIQRPPAAQNQQKNQNQSRSKTVSPAMSHHIDRFSSLSSISKTQPSPYSPFSSTSQSSDTNPNTIYSKTESTTSFLSNRNSAASFRSGFSLTSSVGGQRHSISSSGRSSPVQEAGSLSTSPVLELSLSESNGSGSLLDFEFSTFSPTSAQDFLAGFGPRPLPTPSSTVKPPKSNPIKASSQTPTGSPVIQPSSSGLLLSSGREAMSSSPDSMARGPNRLYDSHRTSSRNSVSSSRSSTPNPPMPSLKSHQNSLPSSLRSSSSPSSSSPPSAHSSPPTSHDRHVIPDPTPKAKLNRSRDPAPFMLDLDISGRGPSLGYGKISTGSQNSEDEDGEEFYVKSARSTNGGRQRPLLQTSQKQQQQPPPAQNSGLDEDPYLSSSPTDEGSDDEDDVHSVQYDGSSSDHSHSKPGPSPLSSMTPSSSQSLSGPYLNQPDYRAPSPAPSSGAQSTSSLASAKKAINIFKPFQKQSQHARHLGSNPQDIYPSPVSSSTSFNTTASKKSKGSNRIGRFISRVTGQNPNPPPGSESLSKSLPHSDPQIKPTPRPHHVKRKASLSNLLDTIADTITISSNKSSKPANVNGSEHHGGRVPLRKKSLDLLLNRKPGRPADFDSKNYNPESNYQQNPDSEEVRDHSSYSTEADGKRYPRLGGRRSFDMLRNKFRAGGRKSMDDLSHFETAKPETPLPSSSKPQKGITRISSVASLKPQFQSVNSNARVYQESTRPSPAPASLDFKANKSFTDEPKGKPKTESIRSLSGEVKPRSLSNRQKVSEEENSRRVDALKRSQREDRSLSSSQSSHAAPKVLDELFEEEFSQLEVMLNSFLEFQNQQQNQAHQQGMRSELSLGLAKLLIPLLKSSQDLVLSQQYSSSSPNPKRDQLQNSQSSDTKNLFGYLNPSRASWHRRILFGWLELIFNELREPQPVSRGTCLDGAAGILESPFLANHHLSSNPSDVKEYRSALVSVLSFAIDKLNDKAVYANTLVFAGRMLSLAFFRIEGVGRKLLRALPPVKRMSMRRLLDEMSEVQKKETDSESPNVLPFPSYLRELCYSMDLNSYCRVFSSASVESDSLLVQEDEVTVEMSGNWLIRWTASDSDLPFAFYRAYHRQLATYLRTRTSGVINPSTLITMPGFLFIAASFLDKCDSLVHRSLRSVTTLGPSANNFNAGESANLAMGAKPKVLELAHRRLVSTALDIVGGSPKSELVNNRSNGSKVSESSQRRNFFGGLLNIWVRAITKRTSMWDTRSVFLLLDLLDGLFYTVLYTTPSPPSSPQSNGDISFPNVPQLVESSLGLFDFKFILEVIRRILVTADNTVCVMRTIAFIYSQFEALTAKKSVLNELCLNLLLDPEIFQHLFLHWNSGVRGYYMRLLVWRLSRLGGSSGLNNEPQSIIIYPGKDNSGLNPSQKSKEVIKIILTFNSRLDTVRKRHDELSPDDQLLGVGGDDFRRKRSTICSTRGVSDQPWAIGELPAEVVCEEAVNPAFEDPIIDPPRATNGHSGSTDDKPSVAKVVSWLRVVKRLGNKGKGDLRRVESRGSGRSNGHEQGMGFNQINENLNQDRRQPRKVDPGPRPDRGAEKPESTGLTEIENRPSQSSSDEGDYRDQQDSVENQPSKADSNSISSIGQSPDSPTFFKFEFEISGEVPRSDSFDTPASTPAPSEESPGPNTNSSVPNGSGKPATNSSLQPPNSGNGGNGSNGHQPRLSNRFSKRVSLLPPAALSMLKDNEAFPDMPSLPAQYRNSEQKVKGREATKVYPKSLHQYATRALVEYEQSLEEEFEWKEKLREEEMMIEEEERQQKQAGEDSNERGTNGMIGNSDDEQAQNANKKSRGEEMENIVPRLAVSWPLSFSEDE